MSWIAMRLLSLAFGGLAVDMLGIQPLFWVDGTLLTLAGVFGLLLLGSNDFRHDGLET